jgi:hypothetical protein
MGIVHEDIFTVSAVDPDGKRFDRVSRASCESTTSTTSILVFDFHSQLFPLKNGDKIKVSFRQEEDSSVEVQGDYATNSVIFKIDQNGQYINTIMSAGGLLTSLRVDLSKMSLVTNGQKIVTMFTRVK